MLKQSLGQPLNLEHFRNRAVGLENTADTQLVSGNHRLVLPAGGITVVAGSPGEGKTSLMLNLLRNLLRADKNKKFYFFSYEESDIFLALKLLMIGSNVQLGKDNFGAFVDHFKRASWRGCDEKDGRLAHALDEFGGWIEEGRLHLFDRELDCFELDREIRNLCIPRETGAIFIDYVQKLRLPSNSNVRDRYVQLKVISGLLLRLANELQVPVVVGAQLNRGVRSWPPSLDHIRESADIGQDATLVLALKRERRAQDELEKLKVHVCKNRRGPAHYDLTFAFRGATYRVDSLKKAEAEALAEKEAHTVPDGGVWLPLGAESDGTLVQWP